MYSSLPPRRTPGIDRKNKKERHTTRDKLQILISPSPKFDRFVAPGIQALTPFFGLITAVTLLSGQRTAVVLPSSLITDAVPLSAQRAAVVLPPNLITDVVPLSGQRKDVAPSFQPYKQTLYLFPAREQIWLLFLAKEQMWLLFPAREQIWLLFPTS